MQPLAAVALGFRREGTTSNTIAAAAPWIAAAWFSVRSFPSALPASIDPTTDRRPGLTRHMSRWVPGLQARRAPHIEALSAHSAAGSQIEERRLLTSIWPRLRR